jgi:hypothetical protein
MTARQGTRTRKRAPRASRDQHESAFASILQLLVSRVPGARAAALVDCLGETVDYAGSSSPFDLRVAAAYWRIVLVEAEAQRSLEGLRWIAVRAAKRSYLVCALPDGYALMVALTRAAGFVGWHRAVATCARALGEEAGLGWMGAVRAPWFPIDVVPDSQRRPRAVRIAGRLHPLEILGSLVPNASDEGACAMAGTLRRERGWRVRLDNGVEATLIREPGGAWYADELLDRDEQKRKPLTERRR